jgi:hypothetical protein
MKTRATRRSPEVLDASTDRPRAFPDRPWIFSVGLVGASAAIVLVFFLSIYPVRNLQMPMGWDSMDYVWRTRVAQEVGLSNVRDAVPPRIFVKEGRPAYLILGAAISSLTGSGVLSVAVILPLIMPVAMGLAAGSLLRGLAGLPWWGLPLGAVVAGTSLNAILMIQYGYVDNLIVSAVVMAAAVPMLLAVEDGRHVVPAILLLVAAAVIELPFFLVALGALGLTALVYLPSSWRQWRRGSVRPFDTASARLGQVLIGSAGLSVAAVYWIASGAPSPRLHRVELARKLAADLPRYRFQMALPWTGLGAGALAATSGGGGPVGRRRRLLLIFLLAWVGIAVASYVAFEATSVPIPANRLILFALAVPVLAAVGLAGVGGLLASAAGRGAAKWVPVGLVLVALAGLGLVSAKEWLTSPSFLDPVKLHDAAVAASYLDAAGIASNQPVIFVVDDRGRTPVASATLMRDHIYAVMPVERIAHVWVYLGSPENYLAGRPSDLPGHRLYGKASRHFFGRMRHVYPQGPVALIVSSFNVSHFPAWAAGHPDSLVPGYGVAVVQGTVPPPAISPGELPGRQPRVVPLVALAGGALLALSVVGLGWGLWLFRPRLGPSEILALAPAVGIAVVVLAGVTADQLGVRLSGLGGVLTPVAVGAAGWVGAGLTVRTRGSRVHR